MTASGMSNSNPPSDLPTRLTLAAMRASALHRVLLAPRGRAGTVADIPRLSDLFSWPSLQVQVAIADLVNEGLIEEGPQGELIVHRRVG